MDRQGERVAHADVPHRARTDRRVDHRQPKRAARLMERGAPNPGRSGGPEDVRCRLDRDAPRSQPAAGRPRAIGAVRALLSLPVLLVLIEAVSFRVANRPNGSFMSSGRKREYLLYVPRSYDGSKPAALVISLHGAGLWGAAQKETSQWNRV